MEAWRERYRAGSAASNSSARFASRASDRGAPTIADTGSGIAPEQLSKLFEPFEPFEPFERLGADVTHIEGIGLGLAISTGLLEAMRGTIEVDSQPGAGSAVTIELPGAKRPTEAQQPHLRKPRFCRPRTNGRPPGDPRHRGQPLQPDPSGTDAGSASRHRPNPDDAGDNRA